MNLILNNPDASDIGGVDKNANGKNVYTQVNFSIYNIVNINTSTNIGDINIKGEEVNNNTNNTDISQSNRVDEVNKRDWGVTDKSGLGGSNIKVRVRLGWAD